MGECKRQKYKLDMTWYEEQVQEHIKGQLEGTELQRWARELLTLWRLLDDIDTADDIAKDDTELYHALVRKAQAKRWDICDQERVDVLTALVGEAGDG